MGLCTNLQWVTVEAVCVDVIWRQNVNNGTLYQCLSVFWELSKESQEKKKQTKNKHQSKPNQNNNKTKSSLRMGKPERRESS